jgi:hypothetical protein
MIVIWCLVVAFAAAPCWYAFQAIRQHKECRRRRLRQRVAYLLWMTAMRMKTHDKDEEDEARETPLRA